MNASEKRGVKSGLEFWQLMAEGMDEAVDREREAAAVAQEAYEGWTEVGVDCPDDLGCDHATEVYTQDEIDRVLRDNMDAAYHRYAMGGN